MKFTIRRGTRALAALGVAAACAATLAASPATADPSGSDGKRTEIDGGLVTPLSLAVQPNGTVFVSQNFAGVLMRRVRDGEFKPVASAPNGGEIGAVSVTPRGDVVTYAVTRESGTYVRQIRQGRNRLLARLDTFEARTNPDGNRTYGFYELGDACLAQVGDNVRAKYQGIVESHPYATTMVGNTVYVADAAANAIFAINRAGTPRRVAVLPAPVYTIDAGFAEANDLPACTVGHPYRVEPVPTDVEVGPDGRLYVSTLPGGITGEGESLFLGAVHRVNPATGAATTVLDGLNDVTGVGIDDNGDIYAAQLFFGTIVRLRDGAPEPEYFKVRRLPGDLEVVRGHLWATVNVLPSEGPPDGRVVRWNTNNVPFTPCATLRQGQKGRVCQ